MFRTRIVILLITISVIFISYQNIKSNLKAERNNVSIFVNEPFIQKSKLNIAVVGDVHLNQSRNSLNDFVSVIKDIRTAHPDLVVFVGDYTTDPKKVVDIAKHRSAIAAIIKLLDRTPVALVLGNYESWSNAEKWYSAFKKRGLNILENETIIFEKPLKNICVRGLGDYYTDRFKYIPFPEECKKMVKITLTHDPAGAFHKDVTGLVISGHTHCGQIRFPLIGSLWVPTEAPSKAHCGLYKDSQRTVFTTSGIGTTLLPLRIGTQAQWDFLTIEIGS